VSADRIRCADAACALPTVWRGTISLWTKHAQPISFLRFEAGLRPSGEATHPGTHRECNPAGEASAVIVGVGIDIVDLDRFRGGLSDTMIAELFLPGEIEYASSQARSWENFGARFAAKEAVFKALGAGLAQGMRWHDVEVCRDKSGAVFLRLHGKATELARQQGVTRSFLSLSHTGTNAIAVAILEGE